MSATRIAMSAEHNGRTIDVSIEQELDEDAFDAQSADGIVRRLPPTNNLDSLTRDAYEALRTAMGTR